MRLEGPQQRLTIYVGESDRHGLGLYHDVANGTVRTVLGSGGLGAFTTFSAFTFETVRLAEEGALDDAVRNAAAGVLLGVAAAGAGLALTAL